MLWTVGSHQTRRFPFFPLLLYEMNVFELRDGELPFHVSIRYFFGRQIVCVFSFEWINKTVSVSISKYKCKYKVKHRPVSRDILFSYCHRTETFSIFRDLWWVSKLENENHWIEQLVFCWIDYFVICVLFEHARDFNQSFFSSPSC